MTYDHTKHMRERRQRWKDAGLCHTCGREKQRDDIVRCAACDQKQKDARLLREYGITRPEFDAMISRQGYKCAICHKPIKYEGRDTHVDHDHETGEARGILCLQCNVWLGTYEKLNALGIREKFDEYLSR